MKSNSCGEVWRAIARFYALRTDPRAVAALDDPIGQMLDRLQQSGEVRILTRRTVDLGAELYDTARSDAEELGYSTASTRQLSQGPDILAGWSDDRRYTACRAHTLLSIGLDRPNSLTRDNPQDRLVEAGADWLQM